MKAFILSIFLGLTTFANVLDIEWDTNFNKTLVIKCEEDDVVCRNYFGGIARLPEAICMDCFSNDANMSFIFKNIGRYITVGEELDRNEFWDFLYYENDYITMNYKTPYNLVHSYSLIKSKLLFRKLCADSTQEPIIFFEKNSDGTIDKPIMSFCGDKAYKLNLFEVNESIEYASQLY